MLGTSDGGYQKKDRNQNFHGCLLRMTGKFNGTLQAIGDILGNRIRGGTSSGKGVTYILISETLPEWDVFEEILRPSCPSL
jgi:hypothetical protein